VAACEQLQDQMAQLLADAMVPVARGLVGASSAPQRWIAFRHPDEQIEDMVLLLFLSMD
jgi:hypothetical protein